MGYSGAERHNRTHDERKEYRNSACKEKTKKKKREILKIYTMEWWMTDIAVNKTSIVLLEILKKRAITITQALGIPDKT